MFPHSRSPVLSGPRPLFAIVPENWPTAAASLAGRGMDAAGNCRGRPVSPAARPWGACDRGQRRGLQRASAPFIQRAIIPCSCALCCVASAARCRRISQPQHLDHVHKPAPWSRSITTTTTIPTPMFLSWSVPGRPRQSPAWVAAQTASRPACLNGQAAGNLLVSGLAPLSTAHECRRSDRDRKTRFSDRPTEHRGVSSLVVVPSRDSSSRRVAAGVLTTLVRLLRCVRASLGEQKSCLAF